MRNEPILITGGAGFVGTNLARRFLNEGRPVHLFDNCERPGVERNAAEILERFPGLVRFTEADIRHTAAVDGAVRSAGAVFHLAAQVAVTSSLGDPFRDAQTNLIGTLNVLESIRQSGRIIPLVFTSTNKVYGKLKEVDLAAGRTRYSPVDADLRSQGIGENQPLEFLSPYGCSKGSADQYVLDYARSYGLAATVFRMSCIYGPYQLGSEDQGWVAHFIRQIMKTDNLTIFGDGKQVRDLLYVDDLVDAMFLALDNMQDASGEAFNLGGGAVNAFSLQEVIAQVERISGQTAQIEWGRERLGDQRWYISNTVKVRAALGWEPKTGVREGISNLIDWYSRRPELVGQSHMQVA